MGCDLHGRSWLTFLINAVEKGTRPNGLFLIVVSSCSAAYSSVSKHPPLPWLTVLNFSFINFFPQEGNHLSQSDDSHFGKWEILSSLCSTKYNGYGHWEH